MDAYEATRVVLARIQALDPDNAAKIMGLLLLQDHGDKEMIRLALGPESLLHSVVLKARKDLVLIPPSSSPSRLLGTHMIPSPLTVPNPSWTPANPLTRANSLNGSVMDDLHSPEEFGEDSIGFPGWRPCLYYARGYCKNGNACRFLHGLPEESSGCNMDAMVEHELLLRSKSPRLNGVAAGYPYSPTTTLPLSPTTKCMNFFLQQQHNEPQRVATAVTMGVGEDIHKFMGRARTERSDLSPISNPGSRQIYLTFPADSTFREEDVSNYFSIYGPVQDVRIPYQQKRMFGFVTFVYPETVKLILAKGNPHFVCDARVLVKPYKEKGKVPDKYRKQMQQQQQGDYSVPGTPPGLDSRDPFDLQQLGARMLYNNSQEVLLRRRIEEQQQALELRQAIELQQRRIMGLQLFDIHTRIPPTSSTISTPLDVTQEEAPLEDKTPSPGASGAEQWSSSSCGSGSQASVLGQLQTAVNDDDKEESGGMESPNEDGCFQESNMEHNLPDSPFASPTKEAALLGGSFFSTEADMTTTSSPLMANDNSNSSSTTHLMNSYSSCFLQMQRLPSGHGAIGM